MALENPQMTVLPSFTELLTTIPLPRYDAETQPRYYYMQQQQPQSQPQQSPYQPQSQPQQSPYQPKPQHNTKSRFLPDGPSTSPIALPNTPPPYDYKFTSYKEQQPHSNQYHKVLLPVVVLQQYTSFSHHHRLGQHLPISMTSSIYFQHQPLQVIRCSSADTGLHSSTRGHSISSASSEASSTSISSIIHQATSSPASHHSMRTASPEPKRKHICKTCSRVFTTSGHLARHNRIHTGERKHVCPWETCDARFARQDNCMQHYKTHTNGKSKRRKYLPGA